MLMMPLVSHSDDILPGSAVRGPSFDTASDAATSMEDFVDSRSPTLALLRRVLDVEP